ncbi:TonB-dependent receptor plug domain-containing protein [Fulvivirga lutea]|uniref:TonB-dependent receptor n=1 Tax=Fulvivirga lutea TaxID=2810512 RepID=A0A974WM41_9BACT|nr:TonB-dependent receptor plug domain-containing protein [Fulvivirga lutea]QSE98765.1 TonB-dependent receptor [Fulvivirga lutea]
MKNTIKFLTVMALAMVIAPSYGQEEDIFELSLEELMDIDIYSVSKKAESLFEAPLSSSTLTKEEIYNAGATSIPEALRLVPGLIVREMTNGSYDIHLRGFDNINRYGDGTSSANQITLVMIDGRPVFNYNLGGTNWEALPVDLVDVERIEVVRGPSAPLYGPNAVAGVINIITKDVDGDGVVANANVSAGTDNTYIGGVRLGYQFNEKFSAQVSGNFQRRDRQDDEIFLYQQNAYGDPGNDNFETGVERNGVNLMLDYAVAEDFNIGVQTGLQRAEVVKPFTQNATTPFSQSVYESEYVNLAVNKGGLSGRFSYTTGFDDLNKGAAQVLLKYDYSIVDANLEYNWNLSDKISVRPGFSYQSAAYNNEDYVDLSQGTIGVFQGEQTVENIAGSLMADIEVTEKLRLVAGGRVDKFNSPDEAYFAYQFAATYDINDKNLIRAVVSKSNSGSFIGPNFLDVQLPPANLYYQGDKNLDLFQIQMFELGYRTKLSNKLELNIELFRQQAENTNALIVDIPQAPYTPGGDYFRYVNMPVESVQNGVTLSANYVPSTKVQLKPFVTFQKTESENLASSQSIFGLADLSDDENDQTPAVYGGFYLNVKATEKLTVNLNPYFMSEQNQYSFYDNVNPATTVGEIDSRLIVNAKVNYMINNHFNVYLNGRNLLGDEKAEFYGTDRTSMLLMAGASIKF